MSSVTPNRRRLRWVISHTATGPSPTCENRNVVGDEWGVLKTTAITWEGWDPTQHKVLPEQYWGNKAARVQVGDVVVTKAGPRHRVGVAAYVSRPSERLIVSGKMVLLRPDPKVVDGRYLAWSLSTPGPQSFLESRKTGMAESQMNFANEDLLGMPLDLPHLEEQRRIADFLDAETAHIDKLIFFRSNQSRLVEERHASSLDETFSRHNYIPTRLKYLLTSKPRYGVLVPQFVDGDGVRFIRVNDLLDLSGRAASLRRIPNELSAQYSRTVTRAGDVLLSVVGTMGRSAIVPPELEGANVARAVASLRPRAEVSAELISAWLTTPEFMRQAANATSSDTAQPTLGMEDLSNFRLSWPVSLTDQKNLLSTVRTTQQHYSSLTRVFREQSRLLAERRQALITAAVTGQFDVSTASGRNVTEGVSA